MALPLQIGAGTRHAQLFEQPLQRYGVGGQHPRQQPGSAFGVERAQAVKCVGVEQSGRRLADCGGEW